MNKLNKLRSFLLRIKDYPKIKYRERIKNREIQKCKTAAIKLKDENYYKGVPVVEGLIDEIIEHPQKHYKEYTTYDDMYQYIDYINYRDQSVS